MANIKGQLEGAQAENLAADPANLPDGRLWLNTATSKLKTVIGAAAKALVTEDGSAILTNKTISGASNTLTNIPANTALTSQVPIANGGTGQATATAGFNALSPLSTKGDILVHDGTNNKRLAIGSDGTIPVADSAQTDGIKWTTISGVKNYILNPGAESNTSGWATYADAAATTPVDGTGGSPSVTFTRSTVSPLRGVGHFVITKGATNRQGDGASYDFTIDAADKGRVLQISFDYLVGSGTYADGDLKLYIYDVTNSRLIEPAGTSILNVGVVQKHVATFQTSSDSVNYRLIFHVASTSASAYTVQLDDVVVGPQVTTQGAAMTDWITYTPTGSWTNGNVFYTGKYRRVGDSAEFQIRVGISGGAPDSTTFSVNLPSGLSIDTSKVVVGESVLGNASAADSGTGYHAGVVLLNNATSVYAAGENSAGVWTQSLPMTWASGDIMMLNFKAPIVGWSSNAVVSSETDTRVVSFNGINSGSQAVTADTTNIAVTATKDSHGAWSGTVYTVKVPGDYVVGITTADTASAAAARVYKNGSASNWISGGPANNYWGGSTLVTGLVAGDTIAVRSNTTGTLAANTNISIHRLSGPAQIAASESVAAHYYASGAISWTATGGGNYDTKVFDTHNAVTTGANAWKFTAPISGKYRVDASVVVTSSTQAWAVYKNGSLVRTLFRVKNVSGDIGSGSAIIQLLAGEYLDVRLDSSTATGDLNTLANNIYIERIGNY